MRTSDDEAEVSSPSTPILSEYPRASKVLLHLSDTHLVAGDEILYGAVDSEARLREALLDIEALQARPDAIIFTGDLADRGQPEAYRKLRQMVEPVAERIGAELIWVMGNHDARPAFHANMLDAEPSQAPADAVYDMGGLRIISLDSTVPEKHYGEVRAAQLEWLTQVLSTPAEHGTILAMHHPPIPTVQDLAVAVELRDQHLLATVLRGTDVRAIIAGHLHYSSTSMFAGIPVSAASATCYTQDLAAQLGSTSPRDGAQAFNMIHVYEETIVHSVVPVGHGKVMSFTSAERTAELLSAANIVIRS